MAGKLLVGETVFVPISIIKKLIQNPSAFHRTSVISVKDRSVEVDVGDGDTEWVSSSKCQRNIGIIVVAIGDFESETSLIDPLSKLILQFCRLLCSDDYVRYIKVRSVLEFSKFWERDHRAYSHIVFVGHGNGSALKFAVDGWVAADGLSDALDVTGIASKCVINLSCELGKAAFGKRFSMLKSCDSFIAPYHPVHGAIASHFVESFLIYSLLHGETVKVAFRHSRDGVAGSTSFRMWRNGQMITD